MRGVRAAPIVGLFLAGTSLAALPARAAPSASDEAEALFRQGRTKVETGDYAHACPLFLESLRLEFANGTLLNLASCEEHVGARAHALEHYSELVRRLPPGDERLELAKQRAADLDRTVPRLTISLSADAPAGARVARDGVWLHPVNLDMALPVEEGAHVIVVEAPDGGLQRQEVQLTEGERRVVIVPLAAPTSPPETALPVADRSGSEGVRTAGWIVGAAGATSLAVGAAFGVRALMLRSESDALCSSNVCSSAQGPRNYDDARTSSRIADVALGAGLLAVATAGYLLFFAPTTKEHAGVAGLRWSPSGVEGSW